ncbi:MAG: GTPase HflX [Candidatus Omnitrophica bacterium]|nr:GTPase HflX [Candidatus Omnitrophota bacterium]MCF7893861.1 GTPase HflX [Candidatus Omnitrophota bacterium]
MIETRKKEKALLVVAKTKEESWSRKMLSSEFKALVLSTGIEVVKVVDFNLNQPNASLYIGKGKAQELKEVVEEKDINVVIFNSNLNYSQQRNLEDLLGLKTLDRTQLILDIFAKHAKTKEGSLQVELAQLQYLLPRLRGRGVMLSRLGGGIGTVGPGETKLEVDRRKISERITRLKNEIKQISQHRDVARKKRQRQKIPICSLVGYTNAGKTTLFNLLTENNQKTSANLFTTLDTVTRKTKIEEGMDAIISDTVGFIHRLPPNLIEAFKATLEELNYSDLLLHVIDASAANIKQIRRSVEQVLTELDLKDKDKIVIFNKIDSLDQITLEKMERAYPDSIFISASTGQGIAKMKEEIYKYLSNNFLELVVKIPISRMDIMNFFYRNSQVLKTKYDKDNISCWIRISRSKLPFLKKENLEMENLP